MAQLKHVDVVRLPFGTLDKFSLLHLLDLHYAKPYHRMRLELPFFSNGNEIVKQLDFKYLHIHGKLPPPDYIYVGNVFSQDHFVHLSVHHDLCSNYHKNQFTHDCFVVHRLFQRMMRSPEVRSTFVPEAKTLSNNNLRSILNFKNDLFRVAFAQYRQFLSRDFFGSRNSVSYGELIFLAYCIAIQTSGYASIGRHGPSLFSLLFKARTNKRSELKDVVRDLFDFVAFDRVTATEIMMKYPFMNEGYVLTSFFPGSPSSYYVQGYPYFHRAMKESVAPAILEGIYTHSYVDLCSTHSFHVHYYIRNTVTRSDGSVVRGDQFYLYPLIPKILRVHFLRDILGVKVENSLYITSTHATYVNDLNIPLPYKYLLITGLMPSGMPKTHDFDEVKDYFEHGSLSMMEMRMISVPFSRLKLFKPP